jgi:uncharacterized protein YndB with AHSA1/START domain
MMDKPEFVYVTYILATPEKVWSALVDGEMTRQYWFRHRNASDWQPGSKWEHQDYDDPKTVDVVGKVVESDPPRRLVITWANPGDAEAEEKHTRVTLSKMAQVVSGQIVRQDYALRFQTTSAPVVRLHFHHRLCAARRRMVTHGDACLRENVSRESRHGTLRACATSSRGILGA